MLPSRPNLTVESSNCQAQKGSKAKFLSKKPNVISRRDTFGNPAKMDALRKPKPYHDPWSLAQVLHTLEYEAADCAPQVPPD